MFLSTVKPDGILVYTIEEVREYVVEANETIEGHVESDGVPVKAVVLGSEYWQALVSIRKSLGNLNFR